MAEEIKKSEPPSELGEPTHFSCAIKPLPLSFHGLVILFLTFAILAGGGSITAYMVLKNSLLGMWSACIAVVFMVIGIFLLIKRSRNRARIHLFEHGIKINDKPVLLNQIDSFKYDISHGRIRKTAALHRIVIKADDKKFDLSHVIPYEGGDPFFPWLGAFVSKMAEEIERRVNAGASFTGKNWKVDQKSFFYKKNSMPRAEIAHCDIFESKVAVWLIGKTYPSISIPRNNDNAVLLHAYLSKLNLDQFSEPTSASEMGRVIFRVKPAHLSICLALMLLVLVIAGSAELTELSWNYIADPIWKWVTSSLIVGLSVTPAIILLGRASRSHACHQYGFYEKNLFRKRWHPYHTVSSFDYTVVRHSTGGAKTYGKLYDNATATVIFVLKHKNRKIRVTERGDGLSEDCDQLRPYLHQQIKSR